MENEKTETGLPKNTAAALSYFLVWFSGIFFVLMERDNFVRFHAMQSIVVFGALTAFVMVPIIGWILSPFALIIGFILWLILIFKAYKGERFKLPLFGEVAEKLLIKVSK